MNIPNNVMFEDFPCPLDCPKNDEVVLIGRDRIHKLPGEFTVVKCRTCGLMRTNPRPTAETIGFYYPDDYGPYLGTRIQQTTPRWTSSIKKLFKSGFNKIIKFNTQSLPQLQPGRLLEIGCASGSFLHRMAKQGWQVEGIEFSEKAASAANQLGHFVHAGSLETAPAPTELFDLIVGWMVLEHLHDPIGSLIKLREWAKPDAWLVLSVPNAISLDFRFFKDKWYGLHLPNHLYHYTPVTLKKILERGGWQIHKVNHQRVLGNLIASAGYSLQDKNLFLNLANYLATFPKKAGVAGNIAFYPIAYTMSLIGQTGRITVWARKKRL